MLALCQPMYTVWPIILIGVTNSIDLLRAIKFVSGSNYLYSGVLDTEILL